MGRPAGAVLVTRRGAPAQVRRCASRSRLSVFNPRTRADIADRLFTFPGKPSNVKLKELSESPALQQDGVRARGMLITALDEIIWLLNMRGVDDVPMTPVFYAYL